jgi:hypothetical protein
MAGASVEPDVALPAERHTYPHKRKAHSVCNQDRYLGMKHRKRPTQR